QPWGQIKKSLVLEQFEKLDFEWFQTSEILRYYSEDIILSSDPLLQIIKTYYYKKLSQCKFENTYFSEIYEDGNIMYKGRPLNVQIAEIFAKFKFETQEDILISMISADNGGVKNFKHHSNNHIQSLSEVILEKLSEEKKEVLKKKILSNMTSGISSTGVLENHIGLCRYLKIENANNIVF